MTTDELGLAIPGSATGPGPTAADAQTTRGILSRTARSGAWSVAATIAIGAGAFGTSVLVARSISTAAFGRYSFFMWLIRTFATLLAFGMPLAISRFVSEYLGSDDPGRARGAVRLAARANLILIPVVASALAAVAYWKSSHTLVAAAVAGAAAALMMNQVHDGLLLGHRRLERVARATLLGAIAQVGLAAAGAILGLGWRGFLGMQALGLGAFGLFLFIESRPLIRKVPVTPLRGDERRRFGRYALIMGAKIGVDLILWGRPEIFFLDRWRSSEEIGLYGVALALAILAAALPIVGSRVITPEFSWLRGGGHEDALRRAFPVMCTYLTAIAAPLCLIGAALAGDAIQVLYGPAFRGAAGPAALLVAGSLFGAIGGPAAAGAFSGKHPGIVLKVVLALSIVNLSLDFALIPRFGLMGAAVASSVSQGVAVLLVIIAIARRENLHYPVAAIVKIVAAGGAGAIVAAVLAAPLPPFAGLVAGGLAGCLVYAVALKLSGTVHWEEGVALIQRRRKAFANRNGGDA